MVYIFNEIDKITYDDYLKIKTINEENKKTIKKYIKYEDRLRHEMCIYLLKINTDKNTFKTFKYNKKGKPTIKNNNISISRCHNGIVVAIDKEEIGVDIEDYIKEYIITKNLFLSDKEIKLINNNKDYVFFINNKEAYLKSKGLGIIDNIYKIDYSGYYGKNEFIKDNRFYKYIDKEKYSYSICSKTRQKIKEISYNDIRRSLYGV